MVLHNNFSDNQFVYLIFHALQESFFQNFSSVGVLKRKVCYYHVFQHIYFKKIVRAKWANDILSKY